MKPRTILALILVFGGAAVCVRLGFWQVSRWHEKQALNVSLRAAMASTPVSLAAGTSFESVRDHKVQTRGRYDETRQVLLSARTNAGSPGVEIVTPLLIEGGKAVLVDRGWLYSADASNAHPEEYPEPGERSVIGMAEALRRGAGGAPVRELPTSSIKRYSARWLDFDSLSTRFPYPLEGFVLRQLPAAGVPEKPLRREPHPFDEFMHVSYAIQWFLFAAIILGGSASLAWSRRRRRAATLIEEHA